MTRTAYLGLADFLVIAETVLGLPVHTLLRTTRLDLAESALHAPAAEFGGVEFYGELATKAAVLCVRICANHPLVDGNKRVALICMREFLARNGASWQAPLADDPDGDETVSVMEGVAAGTVSERTLAQWVRDRIGAEET